MRYEPSIHSPRTVEDVSRWMTEELRRIAAVLNDYRVMFIGFEVWHEEPARVQEGMVVYADGTDWNPGLPAVGAAAGRGLYLYQEGSWVKLRNS